MKIFYTLVIALFINASLFAATFTSVADGNWSTYTTWSPAGVPQPGHEVIINTNVVLDDQYTYQGYWSVDGGSILINTGASLVAGANVIGLAIQNGGTIVNNGTLSINQMSITGGTLTNNSTCNFYSLIYSEDIIDNYGTIQEVDSFYTTGVFHNFSGATITSDSIYNDSLIFNEGIITVNEMYNNYDYINEGTFSFNRYYNNGYFMHSGIINSTYDATNAGYWKCTSSSSVVLDHSFTNGDTINPPSAHLVVEGTFDIGHNFLNLDTISGSNNGYITVQDSSHNAGIMYGDFDFCDHTPTVTSAPFIDLNTGTIASTITYCLFEVVNDVFTTKKISIYPNPATNNIFIDTDYSIKNVKILNNIGQVLIEANTKNIDINSLVSGIYFVIIETENTIVKRKLIVE